MFQTQLRRLDRKAPDRTVIRFAATLIREGELVAFPTETVYGLGANGLSVEAIRKIFKAKGRPSDNPLILHVGYKKDVERFAHPIPRKARKLIGAFWPGPLTIVLRKRRHVPAIVTGGLDTVALRMPSNKIALALIRAAGVPIAAPSANVSGKPSPTTAQHVYDDMEGKIPLILSGGKTDVGLESTVIDCSVDPPVILRPGHVTKKQIEKIIGFVDKYLYNENLETFKPKSPGMKYRHYAPDAVLILVEGEPKVVKATIDSLIRTMRNEKKRLGVLAFTPGHTYSLRRNEPLVNLGSSLRSASKKLFSTLRYFDDHRVDVILSEGFPVEEHAITNRLRKAAAEIITVDRFPGASI
jgi:L-threonylcarbamoyladenylate synthase